jgi:hypothetical protein
MTAGWGAGEWGDMLWGGEDYPYNATDITYIDCIVGPAAIDCVSAPSVPLDGSVAAAYAADGSTVVDPTLIDCISAPSTSLNASEAPTYAAIGSAVPPYAIEGTP